MSTRRRPRVRSIVVRVVVFLLLGAVVNVAMAWGCVFLLADLRDNWEMVQGVRPVGENLWFSFRLSRPGYLEIRSNYGPFRTEGDIDQTPSPHSLIEPWCFAPDSQSTRREWKERAGGWPTLSLWSRQNMYDAGHSVATITATVLPRDTVEHGILVDSSLLARQVILPTGIIWPGFAINTLFYAAILWLLFTAPFTLRRWRRVRRGLCAKCAYPVGTSDVCTECGAVVRRVG